MHGIPPARSMIDNKQRKFSDAATIDTGTETLTRQEFKDEADVNKVLSKFGAFAPQRQTQFGQADFDMDLQQAIHAVRDVRAVHHNLPDELRKKYPTWLSLLNAMESGQLEITDQLLDDFDKAATLTRNPNKESDNEGTNRNRSLRDDPATQEESRQGRQRQNRSTPEDHRRGKGEESST